MQYYFRISLLVGYNGVTKLSKISEIDDLSFAMLNNKSYRNDLNIHTKIL